MTEQPKRTGRVFIAPKLKKEAVFINKDGSVEDEQEKPKTMEELMARRHKRMGR